VLYDNDHFSEEERRRLAPYFSNLDKPVFVLINLPETVKGALFARYSRYPGTLRRLFLEEFADQLPEVPPDWSRAESRRAKELYDRVLLGYGDDSVAQLGGAHVACEWVSNVLTKVLQRPRLASYLEQSTRYMAYDRPMPRGGYRYYREPLLGPEYAQAMDELFAAYSSILARVAAWVERQYPRRSGEAPAAHAGAVRAKTFDLCRGLLPAASLSHMGIFASGQAFEQLILHLVWHPLWEARHYGEMLQSELNQVIPSFLARLDRPERGGAWRAHLQTRARRAAALAERLGVERADAEEPCSVRLLSARGSERDLLAAMLFEAAAVPEAGIRATTESLPDEDVRSAIAELVGERANRRHRPSRGFESVSYRFEVVSDYAAFRDLQRHRLLTVQWQSLSPDLGANVPPELDAAGVGDDFRRGLEVSAKEHGRLVDAGLDDAAVYPLCFAYKIRYVLDCNAREAMHLIELRSGKEGHPSYREVAQRMHALISAAHPSVAAAMQHVDLDPSARLERLESESRSHDENAAAASEAERDRDRSLAEVAEPAAHA
jgi:thymidylate synthase ThyX